MWELATTIGRVERINVELNSRLATNSSENSTTPVWKTVINKDVVSDF